MTAYEVGLLDTNVVILLERLDGDQLPTRPLITSVTLAELSVGPLVAADPAERAVRQVRLQETESAFDPLPFDTASARSFGAVAAGLRSVGRQVQPRAFDAMIAAVALANDLPVYTCNPRDFDGIDGLAVVAIPPPDGS